jgi:hypothetical protein
MKKWIEWLEGGSIYNTDNTATEEDTEMSKKTLRNGSS